MASLKELQKKKSRATVWVRQRFNGTQFVQGALLVALKGIRRTPPVAIVEFENGVEHFLPEDVLLSEPENAFCSKPETVQMGLF